jgi:hypothetical protein
MERGFKEAVIESLEYSALPPDCFTGIESQCEESNGTKQFSWTESSWIEVFEDQGLV